MSASYPTSAKVFTAKNNGDSINASHIDDLQDEVSAIESGLTGALAHDLKFTDATYDIGKSGATRPRNLFLSGVAITGSGLVGTVAVGVGDTDTGLYSSGTNALDVATNGAKALGIDSTQFIDSPTQPRCVAYNNAVQSVANNDATVALTFNSEDIDVGTMHDTGSNTSRVTIPTGGDGLYWVRGRAKFASSAGGGQRLLTLRKNGTTELAESEAANASTINSEFEVSGLYVLAAADYIELMAYQNSGGPLNVGSATRKSSNELAIVKLW